MIEPIRPSQRQAEMESLIQLHWRETEESLWPGGPKPDWEAYKFLEENNILVAHGVFSGREMVGYCTAQIGKHLHYSVLYAQHDTLFLREDHRKGRQALSLIRVTEGAAKARGALFMLWHAKVLSQFSGLLDGLKYQNLGESIYFKEL